jgi:acyl-homoserine-lactone acylase
VVNPANGWVFNTNNAPWSAAGANSPKQRDYPAYVQVGGENARGLHAIRVLEGRWDFTLESLRAAAFDSYLTAFEPLIPALIAAYDETPAGSPLKEWVKEQVELLRGWDLRWSVTSVPTSLAIAWGDEVRRRVRGDSARSAGMTIDEYIARRLPAAARVEALAVASDTLAARFGTWRTPWGDMNRFQRLTGDIVQPFTDARLHVRAMGVAGVLRSTRLSRDQATLRYERQQLRGRRRIRRQRSGEGGDGGRAERRSRVAALQRSSGALRHRRPAGRLLLPLTAGGPYRAGVSPGSSELRTRLP